MSEALQIFNGRNKTSGEKKLNETNWIEIRWNEATEQYISYTNVVCSEALCSLWCFSSDEACLQV